MMIQWITKYAHNEKRDAISFRKKIQVDPEKSEDLKQNNWNQKTGHHHPFPGLEKYTIHSVELTGLSPGTLYEFNLDIDREKIYRFQTMPADLSTPTIFVEGGDTHPDNSELFEETCRQAALQEPHFTLLGGDLAYAARKNLISGKDQSRWVSWLTSYMNTMQTPSGRLIPLITTIGNHDVNGYYNQPKESAAAYYSLFPYLEDTTYRVIRFGNYLALYLLDTQHTCPIGGAQATWLKDTLSKDTKTKHKFAVYHIPAFPSVRYFRLPHSTAIRRHWVPIFEQFGLHIAFEHHEHVYKRTHPLIQDSFDPKGIVYLGDGAWGAKPRVPKKADGTIYLAKTVQATHFIKVELSSDKRQFWAITNDGTIIDQFIQK